MPATYLFRTIFTNLQLGYGTAMAVAIFLIALVTTLVFRRLTSFRLD